MTGGVDVAVMLKKAEQEAEHNGLKGDARDYKLAGAAYVALLEDRDRLQARLNTSRCNSGHDTLPLTLWDCPECHNETKRQLAELVEAAGLRVDWCNGTWYVYTADGAAFTNRGHADESGARAEAAGAMRAALAGWASARGAS